MIDTFERCCYMMEPQEEEDAMRGYDPLDPIPVQNADSYKRRHNTTVPLERIELAAGAGKYDNLSASRVCKSLDAAAAIYGSSATLERIGAKVGREPTALESLPQVFAREGGLNLATVVNRVRETVKLLEETAMPGFASDVEQDGTIAFDSLYVEFDKDTKSVATKQNVLDALEMSDVSDHVEAPDGKKYSLLFKPLRVEESRSRKFTYSVKGGIARNVDEYVVDASGSLHEILTLNTLMAYSESRDRRIQCDNYTVIKGLFVVEDGEDALSLMLVVEPITYYPGETLRSFFDNVARALVDEQPWKPAKLSADEKKNFPRGYEKYDAGIFGDALIDPTQITTLTTKALSLLPNFITGGNGNGKSLPPKSLEAAKEAIVSELSQMRRMDNDAIEAYHELLDEVIRQIVYMLAHLQYTCQGVLNDLDVTDVALVRTEKRTLVYKFGNARIDQHAPPPVVHIKHGVVVKLINTRYSRMKLLLPGLVFKRTKDKIGQPIPILAFNVETTLGEVLQNKLNELKDSAKRDAWNEHYRHRRSPLYDPTYDLRFFMNQLTLTTEYNVFRNGIVQYYFDLERLEQSAETGTLKRLKERVVRQTAELLLENTFLNPKLRLAIPTGRTSVIPLQLLFDGVITGLHSEDQAHFDKPIDLKKMIGVNKTAKIERIRALELTDGGSDSTGDIMRIPEVEGLLRAIHNGSLFVEAFFRDGVQQCIPELVELERKGQFWVAGGAQGQIFSVIYNKRRNKRIPVALKSFPVITSENELTCSRVNKNALMCSETINEMLNSLIVSELYSKGLSPHFIRIYSVFTCSGHTDDGEDDKPTKEDPWKGFVMMERIHGDLKHIGTMVTKLQNHLYKQHVPKEEIPTLEDYITNVLFQTAASLRTFQEELAGMHNDLHAGNIFLKYCDDTLYGGVPLNEIEYWEYEFKNGDRYKIPNLGILAKLGDMGFASVEIERSDSEIPQSADKPATKVTISKWKDPSKLNLSDAVVKKVVSAVESTPGVGSIFSVLTGSTGKTGGFLDKWLESLKARSRRLFRPTFDMQTLFNGLRAHKLMYRSSAVMAFEQLEKRNYIERHGSLASYEQHEINSKFFFLDLPTFYIPVVNDTSITPEDYMNHPFFKRYRETVPILAPLCDAVGCDAEAKYMCNGCMEAKYCSAACQERDFAQRHAEACV